VFTNLEVFFSMVDILTQRCGLQKSDKLLFIQLNEAVSKVINSVAQRTRRISQRTQRIENKSSLCSLCFLCVLRVA